MAEAEEAATDEHPESAPEGASADGQNEQNGTESGGESFIERMKRDPEFAIQQYKEIQGAYTKANQKIRQGETALKLAEQLGNGDVKAGAQAIERYLSEYGNVRSNKKLQKAVDTYLQTGKISDLDESFEETEEEDPTQAEIQALRKELKDLKRGQSKTAIQSDIEKTVAEFPSAYREKAMGAIEERIQELDRQAQQGYEAAAQALQRLNRRALRNIAIDGLVGDSPLKDSELTRIVQSFQSENLDRKREKDTGEPGVRSTGRESSTQPTSALEALREAKQKQARGEL